MNPFETSDGEVDSSIFISSSDKGPVVVTSAIKANRSEELDVLYTLHRTKRLTGSERLSIFGENNRGVFDHLHDRAPEFYETVMERNASRLKVYSHDRRVNSNQNHHEIRAIQTALLIDDLVEGDENCLVIIDGGKNIASAALNAVDSLRNSIDMSNCISADRYYPTALLAYLSSFHIAKQLVDECVSFPIDVPSSKTDESERWAIAASSFQNSNVEYTQCIRRTALGELRRDRVKCWFEGSVAESSNSKPVSLKSNDIDSIRQYLATHYSDLVEPVDVILEDHDSK